MSDTIRCLIANDVNGVPRVLRTDSRIVNWECGEISTDARDLGIVRGLEIGGGVYIWEGIRKEVCCGVDYRSEVVYEGKLRPVRVDADTEVAAMFAMEPPPLIADEEDREVTPDDR